MLCVRFLCICNTKMQLHNSFQNATSFSEKTTPEFNVDMMVKEELHKITLLVGFITAVQTAKLLLHTEPSCANLKRTTSYSAKLCKSTLLQFQPHHCFQLQPSYAKAHCFSFSQTTAFSFSQATLKHTASQSARLCYSTQNPKP